MRLSTRTDLRIVFLFTLSLFLIPGLVIAEDDDFFIYQPESRPAQELSRMVQEMVGGVRVQSMSEKIVVYGTKKQRAAALKLMKELDKPARMYRVHVRAVGKAEAAREAAAIEGKFGGRDVVVGKGGSTVLKGGGGSVSMGGIAGTIESQAVSSNSKGTQQVTVLDGGTAEISATQGLFPSGAQVTIRSQGKNGANIKLRQQAANGIQVQNLSTDLDVKLGVWRTVGSVREKGEGKDSEILGKSVNSSERSQQIQVMVELDEQ